jgi:hypothetical protein
LAVVKSPDPPSVLIVEAIEGTRARPSNTVVFNEDGTERLRLSVPSLSETSWRIGYYLAYVDQKEQIVAVYSTRVGDLRGKLDLRTGELMDVHEWR